ncbi:titin [Cocos nucifera]|uniref:Titin n=1 Tax=Cocos nucifera TaxID=13894 RepID=A0A8K0HVH0_COCNU|nr:titin [Cocos nucifera]
MSTMEHLFMQIFERKNWITSQLRQQIESHVQSVAYNLLADGGHPPPWLLTTESSEPGCPDVKELKREQLISGILFPHLRATAPSTSHNNLCTLPGLKGSNVSQSNGFFNEMCVSNQILDAQPSDEVVLNNFLKDNERDSDIIGLKAVEADVGFEPLARIQRSRSRQRDLENRLSKKAKITCFGDESTIDQYTGRMTRSRAASLKPDSVKEKSVMQNVLAFDNVDGGRATRSRKASQKPDSLDKLSKPAKHLKPVEYGAQKASEDPMDFWPAMSANMDTLEVNNIDDAMAPQRCAIQTAVEGLAADASSPVNSGLRMTCTAAPELPQTHSLVEAKRLLFDGIEVCCSNDNPVTAFEKENQEYASEVTPLKVDLQSLKEDSFCRDYMKAHGSLACKEPQDDVLHTGEVMQRTEEAGRFSDECAKENHRLVEVDDFECHSYPSSCNKKPSQAPIQLSLKPTHCISENEPTQPSLMKDSMLNYSTNFSGQQSVPHDFSSESSLGGLVKHKLEEQCSVPLIDLPRSIVASRWSLINSMIEPKHHLLDSKRQIDLDCNSIASLGKESKGGNCECDIKLDAMQSMTEELFHRASKTAHVSPAIAQMQEEVVLPAIEDMRNIDEINRVSGDVHEEISELLVMVNPKRNSQFINCDDIPSHNLEVMSGGVASEKCSMDSPVKCPTDVNFEALLIKETNSGLLNPTDTLLSVGPALLFSETDDICIEAEEAETTAVQFGKTSVARPTSMSDAAENHDVEVECQHVPKNSTTSDKIIGSCKSNDPVLVSLIKAGECFSAQETVINSDISDVEEKLLVREMPDTAEAHSARARYYLRSSSSLDKNFGSSMVNAFSIPCADKISVHMEIIKDDIYGGANDVAEKNAIHHVETPSNTEAQIAAPEARYFLRSSTGQKKNLDSGRLVGTNDAHSSKQSMETVAPACEISWPKKRKMEGRSNNVLATSPRVRFKPLLHVQKGNCCRSKVSSKIALGDGTELKSSPLPSELESEIANAVLESPPKVLHSSKKLLVREDGSCLKADKQTMVAPLQIEHRQRVPCHDLADGISGTCLTNKTGASEMSDFNLKEFCISENSHDLTHSESILRHKIPKSPGYYVEFTEERKICDAEGSFYANDSVRLSQCNVDMADCDETMPEFEGFSIGVPSVIEDGDFYNSAIPSLAKERDSVLEQLCISRNLVTPSSRPSTKYKINRLPDIYQSLSAGILEHMQSSNPLHFNNVDMKQFRESEDEKFSGLFNLELECDGSFNGKFHSHSMPSSSARFGWLTSKPPLTPPVEKSSQKKLWGRSGTSSETVGSNPELVCFRIDENTSTTEENENPEGLDISKERVRSREISNNREALLDVTAVYQNAPSLVSVSKKFSERGSLESVSTESYSGAQKSVHSIVGNACARKPKVVDKEKHSLPVNANRVRKASESTSSRSSKPEVSGKVEDRNKSQTLQRKGCKPNNIVSNLSSFIPLVQLKQPAATAKGKREIKVKALEAAEAAKRLEEKKQNEREMRKAAAKLERARLEQEKKLQQRQKEEERKKKEAEVAARKRQREEAEGKEKERKRRCIDEARKFQREQEEKLCAEKEERELRCKAEDEKEWRKKELMEQAKRQVKSEKEGEIAGCRKAADAEANTTEVVVGEGRHGNSSFAGPDASKELNDLEKSYDMSPYRDSEVEDDDAEEEIRRKRKYIPSWARRECLDQILLSNQHLDPTEIFCHKSSFDLSEVLLPRILRLPS